ncbi:hypothetical protein SBF1_190114 [Candidatus Desulfosporosinus infrequens]|uniref:Uncharacterized protein n=1 Tax=Candidatus Desulfosporosinus infrequens TaxID=2043169 RepID=A0A2U3KF68_9FIRM|nr:hypothetical protein SBF1_190114 [Candidatus Desulfosporosinus infrequens]
MSVDYPSLTASVINQCQCVPKQSSGFYQVKESFIGLLILQDY